MVQVNCKDLISCKNPTSNLCYLIKLFLLKLLDALKHWSVCIRPLLMTGNGIQLGEAPNPYIGRSARNGGATALWGGRRLSTSEPSTPLSHTIFFYIILHCGETGVHVVSRRSPHTAYPAAVLYKGLPESSI